MAAAWWASADINYAQYNQISIGRLLLSMSQAYSFHIRIFRRICIHVMGVAIERTLPLL